MTIAVKLLVLVVVGLLYYLYQYPTVIIDGYSMFPTYIDQERVKGRRISSRETLEVGKVYVFRHHNRYLIKRLDNTEQGMCWFTGDNKIAGESYDSRDFGYVQRKNVKIKIREKDQRRDKFHTMM